jgi:hypothetical protein
MAELVIRPRRVVWVFILAFFGCFFLVSVAMAFPAQFGPLLDFLGIDKNGLEEIQIFLLLCAALFGFFVVLCVVRLRAPVLRVTREGLEIGKDTLAWTDIEDFRQEANRWGYRVTRVRVLYDPVHRLSRAEKRSLALGKLGLCFPPTYIGVWYETGRLNLAEILRHWLIRYRTE